MGVTYFADLDAASGELVRPGMVPSRPRRFGVRSASAAEKEWLGDTLDREGGRFGTELRREEDGSQVLQQIH